MNIAIKKVHAEKRIRDRKPYSGHIFFATKNGLYEGGLKNYSHSGLFIETNAPLSIGEIITLALPYVENKQAKFRGQILRKTHQGYGIELFRERNIWGDSTILYKNN